MKKIITIILFITFVLANSKVYANENPLSGFTLDSNNYGEMIDGNGESYLNNNQITGAHTYLKTTTDNKIVYCSDAEEKIYVNQGNKLFNNCKYITNEKGRKIAYVLTNGYSGIKKESGYTTNKYLTGNMSKDYYITQGAIWYFTEPKAWMKTDGFNLNNNTIDVVN